MSCHSTRIELFYFDDNFRRIAQWVRRFSVAFEKTINLGDRFWISEIRFQYPGPVSGNNGAVDHKFGICHLHVLLPICFFEF